VKFWDSSAIVPLLAEERATSSVLGLYREDPLVFVWWGTEVECVSALARLERQDSISPISLAAALQRLRALKSRWQEVQPIEELKETAERLLRVHNLRAADSLQLAAAIVASEHRPSSLDFVCFDERLTAVAQREGFNVVIAGR
jgi:predicted nucleic acid-binding protein